MRHTQDDPSLILRHAQRHEGVPLFSAGKGECRSPSTGFTGLRGTTAVLDPREEGPAFRVVYLDGRRYLMVCHMMKLSCGLKRRESPADSHAVF